ncbi:MAG: ATP-binding cassette domain-containing protein [Deltaproteobacteria bacterium]|nr:MAG: ATP-binding cassette domain-containing protein [Deltaproteobacteria bacterium]
MTALRAEGLRRVYLSGSGVHEVSFTLEPGRIVALKGANGAGKSTLFRLLSGEERADAGQVWLREQDVTRLPLHLRVRRGLGVLPQEPSVLPRLSVLRNVMLGQPRSRLELAIASLEEAGLSPLRDRAAGSLSGGERRRVELVRTLLRDPRVLLLDEPFVGVELPAVEQLRAALSRARARGVAVLWSGHVGSEALEGCDEVWCLERGRLVG